MLYTHDRIYLNYKNKGNLSYVKTYMILDDMILSGEDTEHYMVSFTYRPLKFSITESDDETVVP